MKENNNEIHHEKTEQEEKDIIISDSNTANNLLNLEYFESKINKLQSELESDISVSKGIRYFFIIMSIFCLLGYLNVVSINIYVNYILTFICITFILASFTKSKQKKLKKDIELLNKQKKIVMKDNEKQRHSQYFDSLVGINIRNLEEYYELVKKSNKSSFYISMSMSIIGILLIIGGLIVGYFVDEVRNISYLVSSSGIVIELITALLFYLYNKSVIQLKDYHDSLLDVQNILLSFKLIDDIKGEENRLEIMKSMIEFLTNRRD
jgi:hypothetical protein